MTALDDLLARLLSTSREAGTPAAAAARALVGAHLESLGYRVTTQRFVFHPSSLDAFPLFGAGLGGLALMLLPLLILPSVPAWAAAVALATGLAALGLLSIGVGLGWIPLGAPREDANLVAVRGDAPVSRWIVAHLDTKAQRQSMAGRLVAVWTICVSLAALVTTVVIRIRGVVPIEVAAATIGVTLVAGTLAGRGRLHGASPGARDNGSGVAGALAAAEVQPTSGLGVLVTGAEEFGMAGARVFARMTGAGSSVASAINLDTIDDDGTLYLVAHDRRGTALAVHLRDALAAAGMPARARRLPLGILVDSLPLARAGMPALTIGRLTWRTLRLIHTPRDTASGLSLDAAKAVGRTLARIDL